MNSVQESKNELEASIRYAENAISSAKQTIESMEFRQEMAKNQHSEKTGREQALERDLTIKTSQAEAWRKEYEKVKKEYRDLEERADSLVATTQRLKRDQPTMPVIPKDVAIAIFREGMAYGACRVCDELENASDVCIEEREYYGHFEVSFNKEIDLSDELDLDYLRESTSVYDESSVIDALGTLCADKEFECRIHGVDDEAKDSASA